MAADHQDYLTYLQRRSPAAWIYRRFWLYPRLCRALSGRVIDIGCGIGDMLRHRARTVGVDVNPAIVDWCRTRGLDVRLTDGDRLPFPDASFQGALLDNVLEHLERPAPLLAEIRRVLVPASALVVGVPGRRGYAADPDHKVFYDETTLVRVLRESGFGLRTLFHMPFRSAWLDNALRPYAVYGVFVRA